VGYILELYKIRGLLQYQLVSILTSPIFSIPFVPHILVFYVVGLDESHRELWKQESGRFKTTYSHLGLCMSSL